MDENNKIKKKNNKKIITRTIAIILFFVILITTLFTITCSVKASNLAFGRYRFYIMKSKTQPEIAQEGSLVIAKKLKYGEIAIGDKVVYKDNQFYFCDEVTETKKADIITKMIFAEKDGVRYQFSEDEVSGRIVKTINKLGYFIDFMTSVKGIAIFVSFIICFYIILRVFLLYKKNNDDKKIEKKQDKVEDTKDDIKNTLEEVEQNTQEKLFENAQDNVEKDTNENK